MNFNVNDNPLLVAPRPVRLTPVYSRSLKIVHFDDTENELPPRPDKDPASPRASPRSSLPAEALEEFLSILRPAIFPPSSPVLRPRKNATISLPTFTYKAKSKIDSALSKSDHPSFSLHDESDASRQSPTCSPEPISDHLAGNWDIFGSEITSRWHAQVLSSPISRLQTRNPFSRHAAHDITLTPIRSSPTVASTPISPAAIPLPTPSPDEALEVF